MCFLGTRVYFKLGKGVYEGAQSSRPKVAGGEIGSEAAVSRAKLSGITTQSPLLRYDCLQADPSRRACTFNEG